MPRLQEWFDAGASIVQSRLNPTVWAPFMDPDGDLTNLLEYCGSRPQVKAHIESLFAADGVKLRWVHEPDADGHDAWKLQYREPKRRKGDPHGLAYVADLARNPPRPLGMG